MRTNQPRRAGSVPDPILVEIMRNELETLVEEMRIAVLKTGRSPMVKVGDFAVTLCDRDGRGIGVGVGNYMTGLFFHAAARVRQLHGHEFAEGDVFLLNDPYSGGSHLPDVVLVKPLFWRGEVVAFAICYSHHTDVGGRFAGSQSGQATSTFEEGLRIPPVRFLHAGRRNEELLAVLLANVRTPVDFLGDVEAKIAGCWRAETSLRTLLDTYGLELLDACTTYLNDRCADGARAAVAAIPEGSYSAEIELYDDGLGPIETPLVVRVTLRREGERLRVDFAGSSDQARGAINMPFENTAGVAYSTLRELLCPDLPLNDGLMSAFEIEAPEGSVVNPRFPAAVAGRAVIFFLVDEVIHRALAQALPDRVPVPREAWDVVHFSGTREDGAPFAFMDLFSGGWGGRPGKDGPDGLAPLATVTLPVELIEREFPVMVEGFGLVEDTAGAGRFRGSLAVERRYRFLGASNVMIRTNRLRGSRGLASGGGGAPSLSRFVRDGAEQPMALQAYTHFATRAGDRLVHRVGGSGGYGDPLERDPALVRRDVERELISVACAERDYAVAIDAATGDVDEARTAQLRAAAAERRERSLVNA